MPGTTNPPKEPGTLRLVFGWTVLALIIVAFFALPIWLIGRDIAGIGQNVEAGEHAEIVRAATTPSPLQRALDQTARDYVAQYDIAVRHGDRGDICRSARYAASAFLQAHNEAEYARWKTVEQRVCP